MKNKKINILLAITTLFFLSSTIFFGLKAKDNTTAANNEKGHQLEMTSKDKIKKESIVKEKEKIVKQVQDLFKELKDVSTKEVLTELSESKKELKDVIKPETLNKLYKYKPIDTKEYESMAWQSILAVSSIGNKELNDWSELKDTEKVMVINAIALDTEKGRAVLPLGLISINLNGYFLDLEYVDGEWLYNPYSLITQLQIAEAAYLNSVPEETKTEENKTK